MKSGARTSTFACTGSGFPGTSKSIFPDLEAEVTWIAKRWTIGASEIRSTMRGRHRDHENGSARRPAEDLIKSIAALVGLHDDSNAIMARRG